MVRFKVTVLVDDYAGFTKGLLAEHGFSVAIEPLASDSIILFDTGQSGIPLVRNSFSLGLDLKRVSAVVLSHSHYDHSGGLPTLRGLLGRKASLVAHPDVVFPLVQYTERGVRHGLGLPYSGKDLKNAFNLRLTGSLYQVEPNVFFLGEVPRNDPDLVRVIEGTYSLKNGVASPHMFLEDTAIALDIGDSLFVISGCSHSGITNIVAHATRLLGKEVKGVIGGFHLADATQSEVKKTISKLRELGVEKIYPGHCTGFLAESEIKRFFKDGCIKLHSGFQELL